MRRVACVALAALVLFKLAPAAEAGAVRVAAISVATMEPLAAGAWDRGLHLAQTALGVGTPGIDNRTDVELVLLPEAFAVGYPPCDSTGANCDLLALSENRTASTRLEAFRKLSETASAMIILGFIEHVPASKGANFYGQSVQNGVVIYDQGVEIGVHYKTWIAGCSDPPPTSCRPWRDETRLLVKGKGIESWDTRLGRFAVYTCSENGYGWNKHPTPVDFVVSPYNCEDNGSMNNTQPAADFPCAPGEGLQGCFPQPTCDVYGEAGGLSRKYKLPSVWADRTGHVYAGSHYIENLGTAGFTDAEGNVVASSSPGVEAIVVSTIEY